MRGAGRVGGRPQLSWLGAARRGAGGRALARVRPALSPRSADGHLAIRRFVRYELGEGIEKKKTDLAAEVAEQLGS